MKHGATLLAQLAGNHARRADTPLARSIPAYAEGTATFETYLGQRPGRRP